MDKKVIINDDEKIKVRIIKVCVAGPDEEGWQKADGLEINSAIFSTGFQRDVKGRYLGA